MNSIDNKITNMKETLKGVVSKYTPFYNKQTVSEENTEKSPEQIRAMYEEHEVNQSFMGTSYF